MTIKLTREEAIQDLEAIKSFEGYARGRLALDIAIDALKHEQPDEWCTDCKEYDTEKNCCPRFNRVIREAMKRIPHDDGTLEVKVEDATKVGRVLISDDKHRGGLYYPDEDEQQGDLISRQAAIEALGEEPLVWCDEDYEIAERSQWRDDVEAIKSVPSADRPQSEQYKKGFEDAKRAFLVEYARESQNMRKRNAQLEVRLNAQKAISADRPRGEWINENGTYYANCSKCGYQMDTHEERGYHNFCPNCGADMRSER